MAKSNATRDILLGKGYFPEVLPPCFVSQSLAKSLRKLSADIAERRFNKRVADYIRYNGTKHDGHRRAYGTVHPIPYFSACQFVSDNWRTFGSKFRSSKLAIEKVRLGKKHEDRAIVVPTLSELSGRMSAKLRFSPYVLKADISQFFPSIYTHTLSWVAHTRDRAKADRAYDSARLPFNGLDLFVQQGQSGQTRGLIVGPDVFRILAEFISCEIDSQLLRKAKKYIVGGVRHVDDFYIGVRSEIDASIVLAHLRDLLQSYELQINDSKTRIVSGLHAFDDIWAQELRALSLDSSEHSYSYAIEKANEVGQSLQSQSPMKLMLRRLDRERCYCDDDWKKVETRLQRVVWHYGHCTDYVCLLVAKRFVLNESIDKKGWSETISALIERHLAFGHHHEIVWLLWTALVCNLPLSNALIDKVCRLSNGHIWTIIIAAYQKGKLSRKPPIRLGNKLDSSDSNWLHNLVGRSTEYSKARFSGVYAEEFESLAKSNVQLIDFDQHIRAMSDRKISAISSSKYGYDAEPDEDNDDDESAFDLSDF